jgi:ABC-type transport system involved in multi-copper enzyme maturation permease subunit
VSVNATRVRAMYRKELREYRRNRVIVATMAAIPVGILIFPLLYVLALPASMAGTLRNGDPMVILLGVPALVPSVVATYAVVGERQQGTLEPVLGTPIRREELVLGKALAALAASLAVAYAVYAFFLACTALMAQPAVASAVLQYRYLIAQVLFTPLLAGWSIWVGMAISTRAGDVRVAQQLGSFAGLPAILVAYLTAFNVIHMTLGLALAIAAGLLILDALGWRFVASQFDRERLIGGTR